MCGSMVDIHLRLLRLGEEKKIEEKKKSQGKNIMVCPITQGGHNEYFRLFSALSRVV